MPNVRRRTYFILSDLQPGMRVLFAPEWMGGGVSHNPKMDRWFGQIVTVQHVRLDGEFFTIEEDAGELPHQYGTGWYWPEEIVQKVISDEEEAFDAESDDAFLNLLNGR